jgi:hypothetical protein
MVCVSFRRGKRLKVLEMLDFLVQIWYNLFMKNERIHETSTSEMVTISRAEYASLKAERDELNQKLDWLLEQVRLNRKKLYGVSSERLEEELIGPS